MASRYPIGSIIPHSSDTLPDGFKHCNGDSLERAAYTQLFAIIGGSWGTADSTHFNLPDLRGRFLRGWDHTIARDPDRAARTACSSGGATGDNVGSVQASAYKAHTHYYLAGAAEYYKAAAVVTGASSGAALAGAGNTSSSSGSETRPINAAFMFIIRYI